MYVDKTNSCKECKKPTKKAHYHSDEAQKQQVVSEGDLAVYLAFAYFDYSVQVNWYMLPYRYEVRPISRQLQRRHPLLLALMTHIGQGELIKVVARVCNSRHILFFNLGRYSFSFSSNCGKRFYFGRRKYEDSLKYRPNVHIRIRYICKSLLLTLLLMVTTTFVQSDVALGPVGCVVIHIYIKCQSLNPAVTVQPLVFTKHHLLLPRCLTCIAAPLSSCQVMAYTETNTLSTRCPSDIGPGI